MGLALRLLLALVGGITGYELGKAFLSHEGYGGLPYVALAAVCVVVGIVVGAAVGSIVGRAITRLGRRLDRATSLVTASGLIFSSIGLFIGLAIAALSSLSIRDLPVVGLYLLPLLFAISGYLFAYLGYKRHTDLARLFGLKGLLQQPGAKQFIRPKILDTSVIIDGRVADVAKAGFIRGTLLLPRFILAELQLFADSSDPTRRERGRRGLEMLSRMQRESTVRVEVLDQDPPNERGADAKLVALGRSLNVAIMTNDYGLNRVAELQGVTVLNMNDLAKAMRPVVLPGEDISVRVIQEGKELGQGVGYLEDGTMIVVENGARHVNSEITITVMRVLNTVGGRMIFAQPKGDEMPRRIRAIGH